MATPAQITANRANALRSTGPRSAEGKSVSCFNALKHGVDAASIALPGEDPDDYQAMADAYNEQYQPANVVDRFLVDSLIRADWHKQRLQRLESELVISLLTQNPGQSILDVLLSDSPGAKLLIRTQRQITAHDRAWFRAHRELLRLASAVNSTPPEVMKAMFDYITPTPFPNDLASLPQKPAGAAPRPAGQQKSAKDWPPVDEKTGKPLYFVG